VIGRAETGILIFWFSLGDVSDETRLAKRNRELCLGTCGLSLTPWYRMCGHRSCLKEGNVALSSEEVRSLCSSVEGFASEELL